MGSFSRSVDLLRQTNANRIEFLRTELRVCFTLVSLAETEFRVGSIDVAHHSVADAEKAYQTIQRFLEDPKHARHIEPEIEAELRTGLAQARTAIDLIKK
jgi:hypothetical protein